MPRRTRAGVLAAATAIAALTFGLHAGSVSAHVAPITADCERGLVITLSQYDPAGVNVLRVWIDGVERSNTTFGDGATVTFSFGDLHVTHTYRVVVTAWDDPDGTKGWSFDTGTAVIPVCATTTTPSPTTAPPTTAPPTTAPTATSEPVVSTTPPTTVSVAVTPSVLPTVVTTVPDVASAGPPTVAVSPATTTPTLPVTGGVPVGPIAALAAVLVGILLALAARRPA